jgi:hypothetical protein
MPEAGWPGAHYVASRPDEKDDGSFGLRVPAGPGGRRPYRVTGFCALGCRR